ncbi:hypothetical protein B0H15DRAFT_807012 [Mycena belliarum]|uniref:Uncharacterized protein n=1 Tax=Mycena belliarum TaxID=1033014 RepID=A0AAD6XLF6_9AGAR|nr:hypothetical protein B0H15DRAFT_807012 [Mycena belliae]
MADAQKRTRSRPVGSAKAKTDNKVSSDEPAPRGPKDLAYKASKVRATTGPPPTTRAKSKGAVEEEEEEEEEESEEEVDDGLGSDRLAGATEPGKGEEAPARVLKPISHWQPVFEPEAEEEEDEEGWYDEPNGEGPSSAGADTSPPPQPQSSPLGPKGGKTPPARRARAACNQQGHDAGEGQGTREAPRQVVRHAARQRATSADSPGSALKPPPKKKTKKAPPPTPSIDAADQIMEDLPSPPRRRKGARRVSFSEPEHEPGDQGTPASAYDRHFPHLSPASDKRQRPPQRSPEDWDHDSDNDKITLTRAQLTQLIASSSVDKMAVLTKAGDGRSSEKKSLFPGLGNIKSPGLANSKILGNPGHLTIEIAFWRLLGFHTYIRHPEDSLYDRSTGEWFCNKYLSVKIMAWMDQILPETNFCHITGLNLLM